ncbi:Hypothetical predicted protein [Octopus vulgaris]|uniref:Alkyl hydroperoxide reductase subunit C/ Thiol specific antioxidant domain-containing protein n=2 Tax=Octopus TaxID=6643 RepID=A0AA36BAF7_OCTVU|nr:Hypothetical predicted protein [Octopus vulgaris]
MELETWKSDLKALGCDVLLLFFGSQKSIKQWLAETKSSFPSFQDSSKNIYSALGLRRSVKEVFCMKTTQYYAAEMASDGIIPTPYKDFNEDIYQMGGDFIIDQTGKILFTYRSQTPSDRPSAEQILGTLKNFPV